MAIDSHDASDAFDFARGTPSETPEGFNREQDDADSQAQTVADDAIRGLADERSGVESTKPEDDDAGMVNPNDAQDVVDHINQMERSGIIDYDAFRGERSDDDEASTFGSYETDDHTIRLADE